MATFPLHEQFLTTHQRIALGDRALVAIAAHVEVRSVLRASQELQGHGLDDVLIGSYARKVSIWPGKDVDVFGRLMTETIDKMGAEEAYALFGRALAPFEADGRLTPQPRSWKVDFGAGRMPSTNAIRTAAATYEWASERVGRILRNPREWAFEFSVDVVPAVKWDGHYGIPEIGRQSPTGERYRTGAWRRTDPVGLTEKTQDRNHDPRVAGIGAYLRAVKSVRQLKSHHLAGTKPSSLYYELVLFEGFENGGIAGESWADITASALSYAAERLASAGGSPVCDPVLGEPYSPAPSSAELEAAAAVFDEQARRARKAVSTDSRCQAGIEWRQVFGANPKYESVFPLPPGCRGTGVMMGAATANVATGGTDEKSFGGS